MYLYMPITIITLRYIIYTYETTNILYILKKICFILSLSPKPSFSHNIMECSVFQQVPMINALIKHLGNKIKNGYHAKETEFSRIMFAIIPYYFKYQDNYTFSPEIWNDNHWNRQGRCDGLITLTIVNEKSLNYGFSIPIAMYECKTKGAISW